MKTTIELPDTLFRLVKTTAARRNTTLKELIIHALKREVAAESPSSLPFDVDELGLPVLRNQNKSVSIDLVNSLRDEEDLIS